MLTPTEITETFETMRQCFEKLGFNTYKDTHGEAIGTPGVYLLAHERDSSLGLTDDSFWLRIYASRSFPGVKGTVVSVDFKAGPMFWLQVNNRLMEEQNVNG